MNWAAYLDLYLFRADTVFVEFSYDFHSFFKTYNFYFKICINLKKKATLYAIPDRLIWGIFMHVLICDNVKLDRCQGTREF